MEKKTITLADKVFSGIASAGLITGAYFAGKASYEFFTDSFEKFSSGGYIESAVEYGMTGLVMAGLTFGTLWGSHLIGSWAFGKGSQEETEIKRYSKR